MNQFAANLYTELCAALDEAEQQSQNILQKAEKSYHLVKLALKELKAFIYAYQFDNDAEEIRFFKEIKIMFHKELIYYNEVFFFEASRPHGGEEIQQLYMDGFMERIRLFFSRHQQFYTYYRTGDTRYDKLYYIRGADTSPLAPDYELDMDARFCTVQSFILAKLQAFEMLSDYLQEHKMMKNARQPLADEEEEQEPLTWTDSKADLIELGYALFAKRSVNKGRVPVKRIMKGLQKAFNINLGNFYGVFTQNIRLRKKNRTVFLDALRDDLNQKMDDLDE